MSHPIKLIAKPIRMMFNLLGIDIIRLHKSPNYSLLGLRDLPFRSIIDGGANTGQFARKIRTIFPKAHIYCFEPLKKTYDELIKWADKQHGLVTAYNFALGDDNGRVEMRCHQDHSPSSSILKSTYRCQELYPFTERQSSISIQIVTLDEWVKNLAKPLTNEILIKLDVQGYENRVIKGGASFFKKAKACILEVSLIQLYEQQADFKEITELLYDLGFKYAGNLYQSYSVEGAVIYIDAVFIK